MRQLQAWSQKSILTSTWKGETSTSRPASCRGTGPNAGRANCSVFSWGRELPEAPPLGVAPSTSSHLGPSTPSPSTHHLRQALRKPRDRSGLPFLMKPTRIQGQTAMTPPTCQLEQMPDLDYDEGLTCPSRLQAYLSSHSLTHSQPR